MSQPIQGSSCIITYLYYDSIYIYIEYLLVLYIVINNYLSIMLRTYQIIVTISICIYIILLIFLALIVMKTKYAGLCY
jgi:hypothetical protein